MKKSALLAFMISLLMSCATTKKLDNSNVQLKFLDEYILPANTSFKNTTLGGLSGIDYHDGNYYVVCDQASAPRIYKIQLPVSNNKIDTLIIEDLISLDRAKEFFKDYTLDLEAIRVEDNKITLTSEGAITNGRDPSVFQISETGEFIRSFQIPEHFTASGEQKPRNNGVFEGLSRSFDNTGFWVATELPLEKDGSKPKLFPSKSPIRITYFNKETGEAEREFTYMLDGISKIPINYFAVNGVTEILEYQQDRFLLLERAYSAGYGSHGNTVKIFDVDASKATNILEQNQLKGTKYEPAKKRLIFNFKSIKDQLTDRIIDNIEGISFGPKLPNGNSSLIIISDNNFNSYGNQLNQFFLFELITKN